MRKQLLAMAAVGTLALAGVTSAQVQLSSYQIGGPGGFASSGTTLLGATIGQPIVGQSAENDTVITTGFWTSTIGTPLFVDLVSFEATTEGYGHPVVLKWITDAEIDTLGFHIYRAVPIGSSYQKGERLTGFVIPSEGSPSGGAVYTFVDNAPWLDDGTARAYFLEDIETGGTTTLHGPALVTGSAPVDTSVPDWTLFD